MTAQQALAASREYLNLYRRVSGEMPADARDAVYGLINYLCAVAQTITEPCECTGIHEAAELLELGREVERTRQSA